MGYQALLFCPDEKTARTVTQVLSELEFNVEFCTEPFAAVKRLMGEHFDALVVDCDNEQNATLLFKSARSSTSNQASLAVAVVEGQAGVAKAFRIGANLVLTKPINVEQAKGTLRVARGLLRKAEPAKPVSSATPQPPPATPAKPAPVSAARPSTTPAPEPRPSPAPPIASKPIANLPLIPQTPASAPAAVASSISPSVADDPIESSAADTKPAPRIATPTAPPIVTAAPPLIQATAHAVPSNAGFGSAAATAPALAPIAPTHEIEPSAPAVSVPSSVTVVQPADSVVTESASSTASDASFTFGGANLPAASSGVGKKALIGIAAAVVVAGALYFGWTQFKGNSTESSNNAKPAAAPHITPQTSGPSSQPTPSAAAPATAAPTNSAPASSVPQKQLPSQSTTPVSAPSTPPTSKPSATDTDSVDDPSIASNKTSSSKPASPALVVHSGKTLASGAKSTTPDTQAPSMIGMTPADSAAPLSNLVGPNTNVAAPVLQTMNVSQGVSQGLVIKKVQPQYPSTALQLHVEGQVQLLATISKSGNISAVKVLSGDALLTKAAADAVKQWKYKPYLLNGEPVEIQTQITMNFKLPH